MLKPLQGANILVTGGGGFLGYHLLPLLVAQGARVTCLIRSPVNHLPEGIEIFPGDLADARAVAEAARGKDIIIHMAGFLFGSSWSDYLAANSSMADNVARAAAPGSRVVFVSSLAAAGPAGTAPGKSEAEIPAPVSAYGWSKLLAEQILQKHLQERLVILRPPIIYGSRDRGLLPLFRSCKAGLGLSPGLRDFPVSAMHAGDVARAIILVAGQNASGVYHLNDGHAHTMADICQAMGKALGKSSVKVLKPPLAFMKFTAVLSGIGAGLSAALARALNRKAPGSPGWNMDKYREASQAGWLACADKIRNELGFRPELDLEQGMAEAVSGYKREGWL